MYIPIIGQSKIHASYMMPFQKDIMQELYKYLVSLCILCNLCMDAANLPVAGNIVRTWSRYAGIAFKLDTGYPHKVPSCSLCAGCY